MVPTMIFFSMLRFSKQFQIFNSIIRFVMVYMVDCFVSLKRATKMFFHHYSMFISITTRSPNKFISSFVEVKTFPITFFGTVGNFSNFKHMFKFRFTTTRMRTELKFILSPIRDINKFLTKITGEIFTSFFHINPFNNNYNHCLIQNQARRTMCLPS